jgi:hypothetical protein
LTGKHEDAAGEITAGGDAIDPGDGVLAGGGLSEGEELVDAVKLVATVFNFAGDDGAEVDLGPGNEAGEPHAPDGGCEPFRVFDGAADESGSVGTNEFEAEHVAAESAGEVVILAVDVVGNCAADGYIFGARCDRQEKSSGNRKVKDLLKGDASLAAEHAGGRIEMEEAIHARGLEQRAVLEQADVTVAAPKADGELFCSRSVGQGEVGGPVQRHEVGLNFGIASPRFELWSWICFATGITHGWSLSPGYKAARAAMTATAAPVSRLRRSVTAKMTGSSSSWPREARSQTRLTQ